MQGIGGYLAAYRTILERRGAVVCIGPTAMFAGLMAELDENAFAPLLRRSVGGTGT